MADGSFKLVFPEGGLDRRIALQTRPPYITPAAENMRPVDVAGVRRGGSRPGLTFVNNSLLTNEPVRMLANLTFDAMTNYSYSDSKIVGDSFEEFSDHFNALSFGDHWQTAAWLAAVWPDLENEELSVGPGVTIGLNVDPDYELPIQNYCMTVVDLLIRPVNGYVLGTYELYAALKGNGSGGYLDPAISSGYGFKLSLTFTSSYAYSGTLTFRNGAASSTSTAISGSLGVLRGVLLLQLVYVRIPANPPTAAYHSATAYLNYTSLGSTSNIGVLNSYGDRGVGFGVINSSATANCNILRFRTRYVRQVNSASIYSDQPPRQRTLIVVSAGGRLYHDSISGRRIELGTDDGAVYGEFLQPDKQIRSASYQNKLYIANYGPPIVSEEVECDGVGGTKGIDCISAGTTVYTYQLTADQLTAVNAAIARNQCWLSLELKTSTANNYTGVYRVSAVTNPVTYDGWVCCQWTISGSSGWSDTDWNALNGTRIILQIHGYNPCVYDPASYGANNVYSCVGWRAISSKGTVPIGCPLICAYNDRLVLAGSPAHIWYMSRRGEPKDWDYSASDTNAAIVGTTADAGRLMDPIRCLAPWKNDYLIIGCKNTIWVMRGDPTSGGRFDCADRDFGLIGDEYGSDAWCFLPGGDFLFMSHDGLRLLPTGTIGKSESVSRDRLPAELLNVDSGYAAITMRYDPYDNGVWIMVVADMHGSQRHWWFDWATRSFWPVTLNSLHKPQCMFYRESQDPCERGVWIGFADGHIRRFHRTCGEDNSCSISSYVMYGPFRLGDEEHAGILTRLVAVLGDSSGGAAYAVYVGDTAEGCYANAQDNVYVESGNLVAGENTIGQMRLRANFAIVKVSNASSLKIPWMIDSLVGRRVPGGLYRGI